MTDQPTDKLLTPAQAAEQLNVSLSWFRNRWRKFDTVRLSNGCYRIPQSAVDRYIQTRKL